MRYQKKVHDPEKVEIIFLGPVIYISGSLDATFMFCLRDATLLFSIFRHSVLLPWLFKK